MNACVQPPRRPQNKPRSGQDSVAAAVHTHARMHRDAGAHRDVHLSSYLRKEKDFSFLDSPLITRPQTPTTHTVTHWFTDMALSPPTGKKQRLFSY